MIYRLTGVFFLTVGVLAFSLTQPKVSAAKYLLAELPSWSHDTLYDGIYLDIEATMKELKLSRFEAVELQNQTKDILFAEPKTSKQQAFNRALKNVREGKFESGWKPVSFEKPGEFIVALDMDETLLMQWYGAGTKGFFDFKITPDSVGKFTSHPFIKLTPKTEEFLKRLAASPLCKGIVAFSAKADKQANEIYKEWKLSDGRPLSALVPAIFTRNHLILQKKVTIPSKDLRIFDETLSHVVLVDDNPARVFQPFNLKAQPPFDADQYYEAGESKKGAVKDYYEALMGIAADEILESASYADEKKVPFATAYLPYCYGGERVYRTFLKVFDSEKKAREATRVNHHVREAGFVTTQK